MPNQFDARLRDHRPRIAMTLVELLVVLSILSVLIALALPAIQHVRAAAARSACQNNLHQIGLALQGYHAAHGRLPPGSSYQDGKDPEPFMNWHTRLLPYLEQEALWDQAQAAFRQDPNFLNNPPHEARAIPVALFGCPSDSRTKKAYQFNNEFAVAFTSYLGVEGTNAFKRDGLLFLDSATRLADATDGTSQTLLVGERPPSADYRLGWWYAGWGQDQDGEGDSVLGARTKNNGQYGANCPVGPFHFVLGHVKNQCDAFHFWSLHPGGVHFLFADGSVHFLSYSSDAILPQLATRAGGEEVQLPD